MSVECSFSKKALLDVGGRTRVCFEGVGVSLFPGSYGNDKHSTIY